MRLRKTSIKGALLVELVIALALFLVTSQTMLFLLSARAPVRQDDSLHFYLSHYFEKYEDVLEATSTSMSDSEKIVTIGARGTHSFVTADLTRAYGEETCSEYFEADWRRPKVESVYLFDSLLEPTDLKVRGGSAYVAIDSASTTQDDLFVIDVSGGAMTKKSSMNTGPGLKAITLAGDFAFAANTSANSELQVFDITGLGAPIKIADLKLPTAGTSSPGLGRSIAYSAGSVYLGVEKNDGSELYRIDAAALPSLGVAAQAELDTLVNAIVVTRNAVYVATPNTAQMRVFGTTSLALQSTFTSSGSAVQDGRSLYAWGNTLILGRTVGGFNVSTNHELFYFDASTSTSLVWSMDIGASVNSIRYRHPYVFLATSDPTREFQVVDEVGRRAVATLDLAGKAVAMACEGQKLYVLTQGPSSLVVITGS